MKTFAVQTLGCKVNHYESEQLAAALRARGLVQTDPASADLRVVNTCSVTTEAAAKSGQQARRMVRLPLRLPLAHSPPARSPEGGAACCPVPPVPLEPSVTANRPRPRVIVTGCWATSDRAAASAIPGVDAVLGHHDNVAAELDRLLDLWASEAGAAAPVGVAGDRASTHSQEASTAAAATTAPRGGGPRAIPQGAVPDAVPNRPTTFAKTLPKPWGNDGWMIKAGTSAGNLVTDSKALPRAIVNENSRRPTTGLTAREATPRGATSLPLLDARQTGRQRAFLKVQDGCDAHCTYCIIPRLRPALWSKPPAVAVEEAKRLVGAGHVELVLTGIFLGAYGRSTALRRRQPQNPAGHPGGPLGELVEALCTGVPGLRRLRLSSLEPGDLTPELIAVLRSHPQVVPHFHLPLQSGSDRVLRRMNRQYGRDDFLRMVDRVRDSFDRPAMTTDVIVGFPGETDDEFRRTVEVVDYAGFIHVHAFPFSPRPGTAAARWGRQSARGDVANERIKALRGLAQGHDLTFRRQFLGQTVQVLIESDRGSAGNDGMRHGRCERYFDVWVDEATGRLRAGDFVRVRVERVSPGRTFGSVEAEREPAGGLS